MKTHSLLLFLVTASNTTALFAQGQLTPPGAPTPTMKTLDQVEARKPIGPSTASVGISSPGSYYLAGDIAVAVGNGITITTGDVTLDLNGFTIRRASGTGSVAISVAGPANNSARNVTIRNGHISGAFGQGILLNRVHNVAIEDIGIQGTTTTGIDVLLSALTPNVLTVRRCRILGEPVDRVANPPVTAMSNAGLALRSRWLASSRIAWWRTSPAKVSRCSLPIALTPLLRRASSAAV